MSKILRLEITDKCNLKCKMCWSVDWQHNDMSFEQISKLIYDYKKHEPNGIVVLTSREPLLSKYFADTIKLCTELALDIKLLTNATLLNDYFCDLIINSNVSFVSVSIHGNEEEHDKIVSVPGAYKKMINGLKLLNHYKEKHNKNLEIRITTLMVKELVDSLDEIVELAKSLNLNLRIQHKMFHSDNAKKRNISVIKDKYDYVDECINGFPVSADISGLEVKEILVKAKKLTKSSCVDLQIYPNLTDEEITVWYDKDYLEPRNEKYCDHAVNSIRVRANGDLTFCQYIDRLFGSIKDNTLDEIIYKNSVYNNMANDFKNGKLLPICNRCCHCRNKNNVLEIHNYKI